MALCLVCALPLHAEPDTSVNLSRSEARTLAFNLLRENQPDHARRIALGLLRADDEDYAALMILARADTQLGRHADGARAGRRAWQAADNEDQEFAAAYMVSQSLSALGRYGHAQWWLRRAGQATDKARFEQAARRQFRKVQRMNPWSSKLSFSVRPSSNINGGPTTNTFTIGDFVFVDPTAVPLSGIEYGTYAMIRRDFAGQNGGPNVHLGFSVDDTRYSLSDAAKAASPTARASDFTMTKVRLSGGLRFAGRDRASTRIDLDLFRDWRGGDALANNVAIELGRDVHLPKARVGYALQLEHRQRLDRVSRSSDSVSAKAYWAAPVPSGHLSFSASLSDINSTSGEIAAQTYSLAMRYVPDQKIFGAVPSLQVAHSGRNYDRIVYGADARKDRSVVVSGELFFKNMEFYGFAPTVGAVYSRNTSNVTIFDYEEYGMTFGIRSTF